MTKLPYKYNKRYTVFRKGKIYSKKSRSYIGAMSESAGDILVNLPRRNLKQTEGFGTLRLKHIIAEHFVPNPDPENFKSVININHKSHDCRASNLRWTDHSGAIAHAKSKPKHKIVGNRKKRTDEQRLNKSIEIRNARRSQDVASSTFIEEDNHLERLFQDQNTK